MAKDRAHSIYEFDGFRLDTGKLMLYAGGRELHLPPKAVETLAVLVRGRGEIVSKDDLIDAVWTDSIVEESNLSQYLYLLRRTLGNRPDGSPYIETLRRRGYRFTGDVRSFTDVPSRNGDNGNHETRSERRTVERRGNVLALVDWREQEQVAQVVQPETSGRADSSDSSSRLPWIMIASIAFVLFVGVAAAVYMTRDDARRELGSTEQNITRLTNGIEVLAATISPDGKFFAYYEPEGKLSRIWLHQTGHATRQEMVPTSTRIPSALRFTPDGQYLYFLASDAIGELASLYRVPTLGGPVTKILSEMHTGVSFSPDGREMVYYTSDKDGPRHVIRASDGSGEERLLHQASPGYGFSAWSPDGKFVAITILANPNDRNAGCKLAAINVETKRSVEFSEEVWESCSSIVWAPDGRGVYMLGTRMSEGMSTRRDQLFFVSFPQGKSRKITSDGNRHQWDSLGVTKDGSVLVVPFNRSSQIWVMDPSGDTRSAVQITFGQADGRGGIAPLTDGRVTYIARTGENLNVWVMNADGSEEKQITDNSQPMEELRSGGDGRYLVFSGYLTPRRPHLFRMNIDGSDLKQITAGDSYEIDSSMSHDGKWIAYDSGVFFGDRMEASLWKQSMETGERVSLNQSDCQMPHFSPDDKFISCVRAQKDILILNSGDGSVVHTLRVPQIVTVNHSINFGARWTPDGKSVAYIVNDKGISNIWTHPVDGAPPKQLTNFSGGSIYHFAYSLDGRRLFVARGYQIRDAVLIREIDQ